MAPIDPLNPRYYLGQFHEIPFAHHQQGSYAPSAFVHQDGFSAMETSPVDDKSAVHIAKDANNMHLNYPPNDQVAYPAEKYVDYPFLFFVVVVVAYNV